MVIIIICSYPNKKNTLDKNQLEVKLISFVSLSELRNQYRKTNISETQEKNNLNKFKSVISRIYLSEMSKVTIKKKLKKFSDLKCLYNSLMSSLSLQSYHYNRTSLQSDHSNRTSLQSHHYNRTSL